MDLLISVLVSAVLLAGVYYIMSLGLNIIFGVLDIVNFAHGAFVILGAYASYAVWSITGWSPYLLVFVSILGVGAFGAVIYLFYLRFTVDEPLVRMFGLVGISSVVASGLFATAGASEKTIEMSRESISIFGASVRASQLVSFLLAVFLGALTLAWLRYTRSGKAVRAVVDDRVALRLCGVDDRRISLLAFVVGSGLAGAGGGVIATYVTFGPESGLSFAVIAFSVVILGGLGDLAGAAIAAFLIALVNTATSVYIDPGLVDAFIFLLLLVSLLARPRGVLNRGRA